MAKSKKKGKSSFLPFIGFLSFLFSVAAICFGFAPFITTKGSYSGADYGYLTGFQEAFGATQKSGDGTPSWGIFADDSTLSEWVISPKVGLMIAFILIAVGALFALLSVFCKKKRNAALLSLFLGGILMLAAGIMFFFPISFGNYTGGLVNVSLGYGAIISGILGILGGLFSLSAVIYSKI